MFLAKRRNIMQKPRPPQVSVKLAISEAILKHTHECMKDTLKNRDNMFPLGCSEIINAAVDKAYDDFAESEIGQLEAKLRLVNDSK